MCLQDSYVYDPPAHDKAYLQLRPGRGNLPSCNCIIFATHFLGKCGKEKAYIQRLKALAVAFSDATNRAQIIRSFRDTWEKSSQEGGPIHDFGRWVEEIARPLNASKEARVYVDCAAVVLSNCSQTKTYQLSPNHLKDRGVNVEEVWWSTLVVALFSLLETESTSSYTKAFRNQVKALCDNNEVFDLPSKKKMKRPQVLLNHPHHHLRRHPSNHNANSGHPPQRSRPHPRHSPN